jgi:hypothetical protein
MRVNGQVQRASFATMDEAIDELEACCRAVSTGHKLEPVKVARRTYDPVVQVQARAELRGPDGVRAGVDVRGDGSTEAYTGRFRKALVQQRKKESAYAALRRTLSSVNVDP